MCMCLKKVKRLFEGLGEKTFQRVALAREDEERKQRKSISWSGRWRLASLVGV